MTEYLDRVNVFGLFGPTRPNSRGIALFQTRFFQAAMGTQQLSELPAALSNMATSTQKLQVETMSTFYGIHREDSAFVISACDAIS